MADTKKKVSQSKKLSPFQENLKKTAEAISKLEAAGYQLLGSTSGTVTVLELTKTKTLKSGHIVHDYVPVWRGKSYVDAVNELIKPADSTKKTVTKKTATKPKKTTTPRGKARK